MTAPTTPTEPLTLEVLRAVGVVRTFGSGARRVEALRGVDLEARPGELTVVRGRSGSGKTTLLHALGGLEHPDEGTVHLGDLEVSALPERELLRLRRERVAFVFQSFGLLPVLSAAENVEVPLRLKAWRPPSEPAGWPRCCWPSAWTRTPANDPTSCPAASSSAWRWPEPSSPGRRSCSPTSPPPSWTPRPPWP